MKRQRPSPGKTSDDCKWDAIRCLIDAVVILDKDERIKKAKKCLDDLDKCLEKSKGSGAKLKKRLGSSKGAK